MTPNRLDPETARRVDKRLAEEDWEALKPWLIAATAVLLMISTAWVILWR